MAWVLVIEDDPATLHFLLDLLQEEGYSTLEATDGAIGIELLRAAQQHVVALIDHRLPDISGMDILQTVAADIRLRQNHRFVLVTADAHRFSSKQKALQEDLAVPVIAKPFDINVLLDAVAQAQQGLADMNKQTHS